MIEVLTETPVQEPQRIRGLEMPWNRVMGSVEGPASAAKALGPWHPQEFMAECVETVPEAGGMMTFVFRRCDGAPLAFRPGQYVNIAFPVNGEDQEPVDRSYSLSSSPTEPWTFSVTVKRDAGGLVSPWVHQNVRPGTVLDMLGPVGAFHLPDADRRARYLFLAAGAGITPIMSMVRTIHSLPGTADVVVLYHGAEAGGFAFHRELAYIASVDSRIKVFYALGDRGRPENWEGFSGRLTSAMIDEVAPDANGRQVYACGPEGYLNTATELLGSVGVDDTSIYMEFFSGDRQTLLEYQAELALAADIAGEIAEDKPARGVRDVRARLRRRWNPAGHGTRAGSRHPGSRRRRPGCGPEGGDPRRLKLRHRGNRQPYPVLHAHRNQCADRPRAAHP
jgi:ferredoxin-NADP reductase